MQHCELDMMEVDDLTLVGEDHVLTNLRHVAQNFCSICIAKTCELHMIPSFQAIDLVNPTVYLELKGVSAKPTKKLVISCATVQHV